MALSEEEKNRTREIRRRISQIESEINTLSIELNSLQMRCDHKIRKAKSPFTSTACIYCGYDD